MVKSMQADIPLESRIVSLRGQKVILDHDLAVLYGVATKRLNEQVKRNQARFPLDFMFQLSKSEKDEVVANCDHLAKLKFSRTCPYAFTEHGALMAANVLNTEAAINMSVYVMRAFIRQRALLLAQSDILKKLAQLDAKLLEHDEVLRAIWNDLQPLLAPPPDPPRKQIGFHVREKRAKYSVKKQRIAQ